MLVFYMCNKVMVLEPFQINHVYIKNSVCESFGGWGARAVNVVFWWQWRFGLLKSPSSNLTKPSYGLHVLPFYNHSNWRMTPPKLHVGSKFFGENVALCPSVVEYNGEFTLQQNMWWELCLKMSFNNKYILPTVLDLMVSWFLEVEMHKSSSWLVMSCI